MTLHAEIEALERMIRELEGRFSPEEIMALKRVAARERAWIAVGFLAGSFRTILTYVGVFIGAWAAFKAGLLEWLRGAL